MNRKSSSATLRFKILLLSIGTTLAATASLCLFGFLTLRDSLNQAATASLTVDLTLYEERVAAAYDGLVVDAAFLGATPDATDALQSLRGEAPTTPEASFRARTARKRLERTFASFLEGRPYLTQIRLVERSADAPELVRVDRGGTDIDVIPPERLQTKGQEAYMMASMGLWPHDWHLSTVTLNRERGRTGPGEVPTLRVVYALPGPSGATAGYVVVNADYRQLMARAVDNLPAGASVTIDTGTYALALASAADWRQGGAPRHARRPEAGAAGPAVAGADELLSLSRSRNVGGGRTVLITLSSPKAPLMAEADRKLAQFVALSMLLIAFASVMAVILGNRLAAHLSLLAARVTRARPDGEPIEIEGSGFFEVEVLADAFRSVLNRVSDQSRELLWNATHDQLSGLLDRRGLDEAIRSRVPRSGAVAVIQFDLDRFKLVNDTLGHGAGDAVIAAVGMRLRQICEPHDVMCRMGGDEFVVIRSGSDRAGLEAFAREAIPALSEPVDCDGRICRFGVSMGAAEGSYDYLVSGELFRRADNALYRAKSEGRGRFCYFGADMERRLRDRALIASDLDTALDRDEFEVAYMPKVSAADGRLIGLEALIRWRHPTRGLLMPREFLPIAGELKLTQAIDAHVLKLVLEQRSGWLGEVAAVPTISVNVSARRLLDPELVESVRALSIEPRAISFELLESIFLDDASEFVTWSCDALREMGIGIEIDDFGSGHASILGITRIRPDWIKIDQALVRQIQSDDSDTTMLRAILEMAGAVGISTIAEGVESDVQVRVLRALGCHALQGFHIGRPVAAYRMPALLARTDWPRQGAERRRPARGRPLGGLQSDASTA